jgi:hypothetical protein
MTTCPECSTANVWRKGQALKDGKIQQRYKCKECGHPFYSTTITKRTPKPVKNYYKHFKNKTWVITSAVSDTPINTTAFNTLLTYCRHHNAELLIGAIKYKPHGLAEADKEYNWDDAVLPYLTHKNIRLLPNLVAMFGININPTIVSPLASMEALSRGDNLLFAGTQIAMKTVAMSHYQDAIILSTTGAITVPQYSETKAGCRAAFNHSISAVIINEDKAIQDFHYRLLHIDKDGAAYDLNTRYQDQDVTSSHSIAALVTGDEHIAFIDPLVAQSTYTGDHSLVKTLRPERIIRHDVLDFYCKNHHTDKNVFVNYAKHHSGLDDVEAELKLTMDFIKHTTQEGCQSIIVSSNHTEHALRWLNDADPKKDQKNALIYHDLMSLTLRQTRSGLSGTELTNPFVLWAKQNYDCDNIKFLTSFDSYKVNGIECAIHSHQGINGSRGSSEQMSKLGVKTVVGHSHAPKIVAGCYQTGTSTRLKLEYNAGPSSWAHCHVIIYPNAKRTPIFIKRGRWSNIVSNP